MRFYDKVSLFIMLSAKNQSLHCLCLDRVKGWWNLVFCWHFSHFNHRLWPLTSVDWVSLLALLVSMCVVQILILIDLCNASIWHKTIKSLCVLYKHQAKKRWLNWLNGHKKVQILFYLMKFKRNFLYTWVCVLCLIRKNKCFIWK